MTKSSRSGRLCYEKEYPDKQTGHMNFQFEWRRKEQMLYEIRVPDFRILLNYYDKMDDELKKFMNVH